MSTILDPKDYKYMVDKPDSSFSPARNKATVEETIRDTEKFLSKLNGVLDDAVGERIEAVSAYGRYLFARGGTKKIRDFLGKKQYEALVGEKILSKLRVMESVNRLRNNKKYKNTILL